MDFSILKHWVENKQLLCRFSLSLFQALGSWGRARKKRGDSLGSWGRAKKAGELGKKWGKTVSVVGGERKKRGSEEKRGGDCLGSWRRAKKAGERGKKGGRLSW